ncbi:unnamed protein product, partial [Musa hybrid cultivar]
LVYVIRIALEFFMFWSLGNVMCVYVIPQHSTVVGYARTKMISKTLSCRIDKRENSGEKMEQFLKRCFYHAGQYIAK